MVDEDFSIYCGQPNIYPSTSSHMVCRNSGSSSSSHTTSVFDGMSPATVQSLRSSFPQLAGTGFQEYRPMATDGVDASVPSSPSAVSSWSSSSPLTPSSGALTFLSDFRSLGHSSEESSLWADFPQYDGRSAFQESEFSTSGRNKHYQLDSASPVWLPFVDRPVPPLLTDFNSVANDNSSTTNIEDTNLGNVNGITAFGFLHNVDPVLLSQSFPPVVPGDCGSSSVTNDAQVPLTESFSTSPTRAFPVHSVDSSSAKQVPESKRDPVALRDTFMGEYGKFIDDNKLLKMFSKCAKDKVATLNTIKASAARRKGPAKFRCPIVDCKADFTRKHNLENHLKSHCGITDRMCTFCGKGFTTIPVWKRHERSCQQAKKATGPKSFLNELTQAAK